MATLNALKDALRQKYEAVSEVPDTKLKKPLTDEQYNAGFDILSRGSTSYAGFIVPQLSQLLTNLARSVVYSSTGCKDDDSKGGNEALANLSVLEIGPGPKSVLGQLPVALRSNISNYTAFEPNTLFVKQLQKWLCPPSMLPEDETAPTFCPHFPCLEGPPEIHHAPFGTDTLDPIDNATAGSTQSRKFDLILFCHSMYGMKPSKRHVVDRALDMLTENGLVVVFHREGILDELNRDDKESIKNLVCHRTASFPGGVVRVPETDNDALDRFACFVSGMPLSPDNEATRAEWRETCRRLGRCQGPDGEDAGQPELVFRCPESMVSLTRSASTALSDLAASQVPILKREDKVIKNREARLHRPAAIVKPAKIEDVQECVRWALKNKTTLTVVGGGHSGHCLWPGVVALDLDAFNRVHIFHEQGALALRSPNSEERRFRDVKKVMEGSFVVVESGCKTGDIVRLASLEGLAFPLGSRPSVGAGLWLQGGIGHLSRLHGLSCDAIVGAVIVSVADPSARVLCVGYVPNQFRPAGSMKPSPKEEDDLLWAIKGAGTNFGIVVSVVFKTYPAPVSYSVTKWVLPLGDQFHILAEIAAPTNPYLSVDAYVFRDTDNHPLLGISLFEAYHSRETNALEAAEFLAMLYNVSMPRHTQYGGITVVDPIGVFGTDMYMSKEMHGGHGGGKTSSFKRCVFLRDIQTANVVQALRSALDSLPSSLCYVHLLHGGGAVRKVAAEATAFGCRDWDYACVVTGVWPRDQDGTDLARSVVEWTYKVTMSLFALDECAGVYGADLGPPCDPRDAALALRAFGPNRPRLVRLKESWDPWNVLAQACPLPSRQPEKVQLPKLIVLVTGSSGVGKDYFARSAIEILEQSGSITAHLVSISDAMKREYAAATGGVDLNRLIGSGKDGKEDRAYKEKHRPVLALFFANQLQQRPWLLQKRFLEVIYDAGSHVANLDVLFITGLREEAPVAAYSHLIPDVKMVELRVEAKAETCMARRGLRPSKKDNGACDTEKSNAAGSSSRPDFVFNNDSNVVGPNKEIKAFISNCLPLVLPNDSGLKRLADMVRSVADFPRQGIMFQHVLGIAQHSNGLSLCTSLLKSHFVVGGGNWKTVDAIVSCEAGGFIFASALASNVKLPLVLIREEGKLPPPTLSVVKAASHVSCKGDDSSDGEKRIEMGADALPKGASSKVVVVDDVLATGRTLCAVLQLLVGEAGVAADDITVLVVAEFPLHRGRERLRRAGFGRVGVQSLLVFGGL